MWWNLGRKGGSGEKWLDFGNILRVELIGYVDELFVGCERYIRDKDDFSFLMSCYKLKGVKI